MLLVTMLRAVGCQVFGHAPTVSGVAGRSKADYVCGRCGTVLGVFVADPDRRRADGTTARCSEAATLPDASAPSRASRPALDGERELRESTWLDDGGRNADPVPAAAAAGPPGRRAVHP